MNKPLSETDVATPKVTTGPISGSRKIYATPDAAPELKVPVREIALDASSGEPPVPVYDPSGPYTDPDAAIDVERGLPRARLEWVKERGGVEEYEAARSSRSTMATSPASTSRGISPIRRARFAPFSLPPPPAGGRSAGAAGRVGAFGA